MNAITYQLIQAWNSISKRPMMIITVVMTLGLTMGSLISAVTLNHLLLKKPFPYPEQEKIFVLQHGLYNQESALIGNMFTFPGLMELYKDPSIFKESSLVSYYDESVNINDNYATRNVGYTTPELNNILNIPMALGRFFNSGEAINTFNPVAVISYELWKKEFALSNDALNQNIAIRGKQFRVIGVTAPSFVEPELMEVGRATQVWLPWDYEASSPRIKTAWGIIHAPLHFLGKLDTPETAKNIEDKLTESVNNRWQQEVVGFSFFKGWYVDMKLTSIQNYILGESKNVALLLLAASLGLVLICVVNISNLFMSRAGEKKRELAIRAALGAPKRSVFNIMFFESLCLMAFSLILALIVASLEISIIKQFLSGHLPRVNELSLNLISIISAVSVTLLLTYLFALIGTKQIDFKSLISMMQSSGKGTSAQVSSVLRKALIVSQISVVSIMVFVSSVLLSSSLGTIYQAQGFNNDDLISIRLTSNSSEVPEVEESRQFMKKLIGNLNNYPAVQAVSQSTSPYNDYAVQAIEIDNTEQKFSPNIKWIDHNYLSTIQQPLLYGRNFNSDDIRDNNNIVLINDTLAKQIGELNQVVGMQIIINKRSYEIVGIVQSISIPNQPSNTNRVYMTASDAWNSILVKLDSGSKLNVETINSMISTADKRYNIYTIEPVKSIHYKLLFAQIVTAITTGFITILLIALAYIGLYSIMFYNVELRRFELATRLAIGAKKKNIITMFLRENTSLVVLGMVISSLFTVAVLKLDLASFKELSVTDSIGIYMLSVLPVLCIVVSSCYFPLRTYFNKPICDSLRHNDEVTE